MANPPPDDPNLGPRRIKYKRFLDDMDGPPIVNTRTSKRWKLREDIGLQLLTSADSEDTSSGSQLRQAPHDRHSLEEANSRDIRAHSRNQNTFEETINNGSDSDEDVSMHDANFHSVNSDDDFIFSHSDNSSSCSDNCSSGGESDSNDEELYNDAQEETNDAESTDDCENCDADEDMYKNWIMFESSNVSVWEVFNMIQAMSLRFKFSEQAQQSVLNFAKVLAGPKFKNLNTTKHSMAKIFNPPEDKMAYVFFCRDCNTMLHEPIQKLHMTDKKSASCSQCLKNYLMTRSADNYFLSIDIAYQIETILKNTDMQRAINDNVKQTQNTINDMNIISDVYFSNRYKCCDYIRRKNDDNTIVLTLNVNVDGAPLFNTSKKSLWPIQAYINEIPAKSRFKHFILAGLLLTSTEPKAPLMNIYLQCFTEQISNLMNRGIIIKNVEGDTVKYLVTIFSFPVDSPARAILQNRLQYNAYFGCSWCYAKGDYIEGAMKFPLKPTETPDRSHEEYLSDIHTYENLRAGMRNPERLSQSEVRNISRKSRGSKGPSILTSLSEFDCVWGFPNEYLHSVLLGVFRQQWEEWSNPQGNIYIAPQQRALIDDRLVSIHPTSEMHRLPRLLKDRAKWRGSEWKWWALFYSVPCLIDCLPDYVLKSYTLLVRAVYILLRADITDDDLDKCEMDLIQYVGDSQKFYGERFITFNVHSLLHLPESVRKNGPLWSTSAFAFESHIGQLKKVVSAPKGVVEQITNRTLQKNSFRTRVSEMTLDQESWRFCQTVFNSRPLLKFFHRTSEDAVLAGFLRYEEHELFETRYNRCIYKDVMYHSTSYTRPKTTNNTIVELDNGMIVEIQYFVAIGEFCHLVGRQWDTSPFDNGIQLNHIRVVDTINENDMVVPITSVKQKLVCITIAKVENAESIGAQPELLTAAQDVYVCLLPNTVEVQ